MIRLATADDVAALLAIEVACFGTGAWGARLLVASIADAHQQVLVTTSGDGYGVVRMSGDTADLDRVAVLPEARRLGVGRTLLGDLLRHAAERGVDRMLLEVAVDNVGGLALYAGAGFVEIHRRTRYYPGGVDAVVMERPFAPRGGRGSVVV